MTRKKLPIDLKSYPAPVVSKSKKGRGLQSTAIGLVVGLAVAALVLIDSRHTLSLAQERIDTIISEQQVDDGVLQLVFEGRYHRGAIALDEVTVTAYSSRVKETDSTPHTTASGANTMVGLCAVSRDLINEGVKFGDVIYLEGIGIYRVEDVTNKRLEKTVDIWCADTKAAKLFGRREGITMLFMEEL